MTTVYIPVKPDEDRKATAEPKPREQAVVASVQAEPEPNATSLEVADLRTGVSVFASVGNLVELDEDAEVVLEFLKGTIEGEEAQAQFKARLQEVCGVLARTLASIEAAVAEMPAEEKPPRAQRVLRPFKKAARACATQAQRVVGSARRAIRSRREAKRVDKVEAADHEPSTD